MTSQPGAGGDAVRLRDALESARMTLDTIARNAPDSLVCAVALAQVKHVDAVLRLHDAERSALTHRDEKEGG